MLPIDPSMTLIFLELKGVFYHDSSEAAARKKAQELFPKSKNLSADQIATGAAYGFDKKALQQFQLLIASLEKRSTVGIVLTSHWTAGRSVGVMQEILKMHSFSKRIIGKTEDEVPQKGQPGSTLMIKINGWIKKNAPSNPYVIVNVYQEGCSRVKNFLRVGRERLFNEVNVRQAGTVLQLFLRSSPRKIAPELESKKSADPVPMKQEPKLPVSPVLKSTSETTKKPDVYIKILTLRQVIQGRQIESSPSYITISRLVSVVPKWKELAERVPRAKITGTEPSPIYEAGVRFARMSPKQVQHACVEIMNGKQQKTIGLLKHIQFEKTKTGYLEPHYFLLSTNPKGTIDKILFSTDIHSIRFLPASPHSR